VLFKKLLLGAALAIGLGSAAFAQPAQVIGAASSTNNINITTAVTTQIITGSTVRATDITAIYAYVSGADNLTLEYGSGSLCGTGTVVLEGPLTFGAAAAYTRGNGQGSVFVIPAGNNVCLITSAAVPVGGSVNFNEFIGSF
jgi:hypothetical protein